MSFFPVGLVSRLGVSTPIVRAGRIVGFYDGWIGNRLYPVDMAGFAVNLEYFRSDRYLKNVQNDMMYLYYKRLFLEVCPRLKT